MVENELLKAYEDYELYTKFEKLKTISKERQLVFLCVGNSKIWFDSFGPIFGSLLKLMNCGHYVYGNTKANITSKNINEYIDMIYRFHRNPFIIVVDNALSKEEVPILKIKDGPITCAALSDKKTKIGDLSITYCLNRLDMKNCKNYSPMLKVIKKIVRYLIFVLK